MTSSSGRSEAQRRRARAGGTTAEDGGGGAGWAARAARRLGLRSKLAEANAKIARYEAAMDEIAAVCDAAARGNLEPRVLSVRGDDHLGHAAFALNHLLDLTDAFVREAGASLHAASEERFYRRFLTRGMAGSFNAGAAIINEAAAEMQRKTAALVNARNSRLALADDFERSIMDVVEAVAAAATESRAAAHALLDHAVTVSDQSDAAVGASDRVVVDMNAAVSATSSVAAAVDAIEHQVERADTVTREAVAGARQASGNVNGLSDASRTIAAVVKTIQGIATQTRLLALNATVEAARAGDVGRGFAVVAGEVQKLAQRTTEAAGQIADQVQSIQAVTTGAAAAITGIAQAVGEASSAIGKAVVTQRAAADEIGGRFRTASTGVSQLASGLETVRLAATATSSAGTEMLATAEELTEMAGRLKVGVELFVEEIRTRH